MDSYNENTGIANEKREDGIIDEQEKLLNRMIERQERGIRVNLITAVAECVLLGALVIVFALLVPKFLATVERVQEAMEQVDVLVDEAETSLEEIMVLVKDADALVQDNDDAVNEALKNFNSVDFESLNQSIDNIARVIAPIVELVEKLQ